MCESPQWIGGVVQARMNAPKHITPDQVAAQGETSVQRFALASALLLGATAYAFAQASGSGSPTASSMIPKSGYRFSERVMLQQKPSSPVIRLEAVYAQVSARTKQVRGKRRVA